MIETNRKYKLQIAQGQTFFEQFTFEDETGPMDFTGWTGESAIVDIAQKTVWPLTVSFLEGGIVQAKGETEGTSSRPYVPAGAYIFTLRLIEPGTEIKDVYINGSLIVYPSAIRGVV